LNSRQPQPLIHDPKTQAGRARAQLAARIDWLVQDCVGHAIVNAILGGCAAWLLWTADRGPLLLLWVLLISATGAWRAAFGLARGSQPGRVSLTGDLRQIWAESLASASLWGCYGGLAVSWGSGPVPIPAVVLLCAVVAHTMLYRSAYFAPCGAYLALLSLPLLILQSAPEDTASGAVTFSFLLFVVASAGVCRNHAAAVGALIDSRRERDDLEEIVVLLNDRLDAARRGEDAEEA
jgi:hypothetical protein